MPVPPPVPLEEVVLVCATMDEAMAAGNTEAVAMVCSLITPSQSKSKARLNHSGGRGIFAFAIFVFGRFMLRRTACHADCKV